MDVEKDEFDDERLDDFCDDAEDEEISQAQTVDNLVDQYVVQIKEYFKDEN